MGFLTGANGTDVQDLYPHGACFDVHLRRLTDDDGQDILDVTGEPYYFLGRFFMKAKTPNGIKRALRVRVKLGRYSVILNPICSLYAGTVETIDGLSLTSPQGCPIYLIEDIGGLTTLSTGVIVNGYQVYIDFEGNLNAVNANDVNAYLNPDLRKRTTSSEQGPPIQVTTVNEVVTGSAIGKDQRYDGYALLGYAFKASDRMTQAPATSIIIDQGREVRQIIAAGTAGATSSSTTLVDLTKNFFDWDLTAVPTPGTFVRNLTKGTEAPITSLTVSQVQSSSLSWAPGDRYLIYINGCSNYFPDVYADTLTNPEGGLGGKINADVHVDYESIAYTRRFCVINEYFYDGVIDTAVAWANWANQEARSSLLHPSKIDGRYGLICEEQLAPTGVFNISNIISGSMDIQYVDWSEQALNRLLVTYTDGRDGRFYPRTIIVETIDANNQSVPIVEETLELKTVTSRAQAIDVAIVYLQSRRLQGKAVQFSTGTQALYTRPGDLAIIQHPTDEYDDEVSGYVKKSTELADGVYRVQLSRTVSDNVGNDYTAAVWFRATGLSQDGLSVGTQTIDDIVHLVVSGCDNPIEQGDYLCVGQAATDDSLYRVTRVSFEESGEASIEALLWTPRILTTEGLVVLDYDGSPIAISSVNS